MTTIKPYFHISLAALIATLLAMTACNKDDVIEQGQKPVITLDSDTGVYTAKVGSPITITPDVQYAQGAKYLWTVDGATVGTAPTLTMQFDVTGEVYVTLAVQNAAGTTYADLRIDVLEKTPPLISMALPADGVKVLPNTPYIFTPTIQHTDQPGFAIEWRLNGTVVCHDDTYTFCEGQLGTYRVSIRAINDDGEAVKEFDVEVVETLPLGVAFPSQSYYQPSTDRSAVVGRPLYLTPILEYAPSPQFSWAINGHVVDGATDRTLQFVAERPGEYVVTVTVNGTATATVMVHAYADEDAYRRHSGKSPYQNRVFEFLPAPGQFVNEMKTGGYTPDITTHARATEFALERLTAHKLISLGGFGGYIVVGFDHSIGNSGGDYDFGIQGNAFDSGRGASNEPGIVWVMQDTNGNGLPDDEWYELAGSNTGLEGTVNDYAVTYYRPAAKSATPWTDTQGHSGTISYLSTFHDQEYYYPLWVEADSYTLRGTRLPSNNFQDPKTGMWDNNAFGWGYADNVGSDLLQNGEDSADGEGQMTGFKIANAIQPDGTPVHLSFIDFVKVQTACNTQSGQIGENSCEVFSIQDLH